MNGYDHMAMPYLSPNNNTSTEEYQSNLPTMSLAEQSFQAPTYSTDDLRRYDLRLRGDTVHTDQASSV